MFTKFEDIIKDHRRRNSKVLRIAIILFCGLFLLFNVICAFFLLELSPLSKTQAFLAWKPTVSLYALGGLELVMIFWWIWLQMNLQMVQFRASLLSEHVLTDYDNIGILPPTALMSWEDCERSALFPKKTGRTILLLMTVFLCLSSILSWGRQSMPIILSVGLIIYEIAAYLKAKLINKFLYDLRQGYTTISETISVSKGPATLNKIIVGSSLVSLLLTLTVYVLFKLNSPNLVLFFFAFLGLCTASLFLKNTNRDFIETARFADSVRAQRAILREDMDA